MKGQIKLEIRTKRVWSEVNLDNIVHNYKYVRSLVGDDCKVCAIVKANAYGHGSERVAKALEAAGAEMFAVATVGEALELREYGISGDIIVLGRTEPDDAQLLAQNDIIQALYSYAYATELSGVLREKGLKIRVHIKLDTGMNRIGFAAKNADDIQISAAQIVQVSRLPYFTIEGIFSHFAVSDKKTDIYNAFQYRNFLSITNKLAKLGIGPLTRHICNSDAIVNFPYCHMDMVRAGIILYGAEGGPNLKPAMDLKCSVIHLHTLRSGETVSYGCTFKANRDMTVATLSIGYADGLPRAWSEKGYMLIGGKRAKILGKICMDQCMVDVSDIDCKVGDIATVFGSDGAETLPAKRIAEAVGTISYEILCSFDRKRIFSTVVE